MKFRVEYEGPRKRGVSVDYSVDIEAESSDAAISALWATYGKVNVIRCVGISQPSDPGDGGMRFLSPKYRANVAKTWEGRMRQCLDDELRECPYSEEDSLAVAAGLYRLWASFLGDEGLSEEQAKEIARLVP